MQLEHNVHESLDLLNSDSLDDRSDESPEWSILRHSGHQLPATGHTGTGHTGHTGTGHTGLTCTGHTGTSPTGTGYRSDREHSVCRSHSVRSDAVDHRSTLLNRTLQEHQLELEYGSASDRTRYRSRSSHELRAISASWAYMNYIPLEEILKSAVWSSSSLSASHYLRSFREQTENLRAMGPIIAAQKVVGGRANPVSHQDK